jgi:hypothetical protein
MFVVERVYDYKVTIDNYVNTGLEIIDTRVIIKSGELDEANGICIFHVRLDVNIGTAAATRDVRFEYHRAADTIRWLGCVKEGGRGLVLGSHMEADTNMPAGYDVVVALERLLLMTMT